MTGAAFVVVNATDYADLEIVVLGLLDAEEAGRSFLHRTGPSFVRALTGIEPKEPLTPADIWPAGHPGGHGLVVVGSHVGLTSRQVLAAQERGGVAEVELRVPTLIDPVRRDAHIAETAAQVVEALGSSEVLLFTSRTLMRGGDADDSLAISRNVSSAVIEVVRAALAARPSWVVAKGGITAHDVAVRGLGIRRAEVLGQLLPGMVSVFRPVDAAPEAVGVPYVVFAGNVGDENTLANVIDLFSPRTCLASKAAPTKRRRKSPPDKLTLLAGTAATRHPSEGDAVMLNVGWIGLGAMGSPMARCLTRAGHQVTAYDLDPARAQSLADEGVKPVSSIAEAAADADVLAVMVATPAQGESVLFGDGHAAHALKPGAVVLVTATVGAAAVTGWAEPPRTSKSSTPPSPAVSPAPAPGTC